MMLSHYCLFLISDRRGEHHGFYFNGVRQFGFPNLTSPVNLHQWTHYCHIFDNGMYVAFVDGEEKARGAIATKEVSLNLRGMLTLGQEQDSLAGNYDVDQAFRGHIAQVNIWSRIVRPEEVRHQASCMEFAPGDIFSSDRDAVNVAGVSVEEIPISDLCLTTREFVIFPEAQYMAPSRRACHRVGYQVYSPDSREENTVLHLESLEFAEECLSNYHLWIGVTDEAEEGVWRKFTTNEVVGETVFELFEPNGAEGENCILMFLPNGLWVDTSCSIQWPACVPCEVDRSSPLRLRGFCYKNEAETFYEVLGYRGRKPYMHGYFGIMIFRNDSGVWQMYDTTTDENVAYLKVPSISSYPIGVHTWTLQRSMCEHLVGSKIQLSLSICNSSQFTCGNGDCIPREKRCNTQNDCVDFTDEDNCEMIVLPRGYRSNRPPESAIPGKPMHVGAVVHILRFVEVNDVGGVLDMEILVELIWQDSRVTYLNLGDTLEWNRLSQAESSLIWRPKFKFPNIQNGNVKILDEELFLKKIGIPQSPDFNDVRMGN